MHFDRSTPSFLPLLVGLLFLSRAILFAETRSNSRGPSGRFAQGNLAVIFEPKIGRASEHHPVLTNLSSLWCQATETGDDRLKIKHARFLRVLPIPPKIYEAELNPESSRAFLNFGIVSASQTIGKYRCEITTEANDHISGNMFVYMRPILNLMSTSPKVELVNENNPYEFTGSSTQATENDTVSLHCPVIGYPNPEVIWLKDGNPIDKDATIEIPDSPYGPFKKYILIGNGYKYNLQINQVTREDEGFYKCVATNSFAVTVDAEKVDFELTLEQFLRVSTSLAWIIPLLVILFMLVILALTIYICQLWSRYRSNEYNVAQKEKEMGRSEGQKLNNNGIEEA